MRAIYRHLLLPAFETGFKRRKTFRYWRELEESQWLPHSAIQQLQFEALQQLIAHAYQHSPYYRQEWDRLGLQPRQLSTPADFARWPITQRETILQNRAAMRAAAIPVGSLIVKTTGGSTGIPMQFDLDQRSNDRRTAATHRGYSWAGAAPGTRQLYLWGAPLGERPLRARLKDQLYHALHRRRILSCFDGENLAERFAAALERYRPDVVVAYTNPIYEVARQLEESGRRLSFRPRSILIGAEKLHDFQRLQIERTLQAPVFETYGSREFMLIGAECDLHAGLHLTSEQLLVEILDDDGAPTPAGQEGNIVITDLYNYGMPFIRYAVGDRAIAGFTQCPCGRGLPLLKSIVGRRLDMIYGSGGRIVPGEFFVYLAKDFPAIRRYQVIQDEPSRIRFTLATEGLRDDDRHKLQALLAAAVGPEVRVDLEAVEQIPLTPAGKLQVVINRLPQRRAG